MISRVRIMCWNIIQYFIGIFRKRDNSIILFGAWFGERFADNSRFLFQYLSENKTSLGLTHVVWVTRKKELVSSISQMGYEVYDMNSKESIYYHKHAGIHIICNSNGVDENILGDIITKYSIGAIRINLWHGLGGIKGVGYCSKEYLDNKQKYPKAAKRWERIFANKVLRTILISKGGWSNSFYLSTTPFETTIFQKYFNLPSENYIETGYPRNDTKIELFYSEKELIDKIEKYEVSILYLPTFRNNNITFKTPLEDVKIKKFIEDNNYIWIEKRHSYDSTTHKKENTNNIIELDSEFDVSTIIPKVSLIITDYSSVSWDALYHSIPRIFYMPDFNYYQNDDRGFVLDPKEFLIGPAVESTLELFEILEANANNYKKLIPKQEKELFEKYWSEKKDCSIIWEDIINYINKKNEKY